ELVEEACDLRRALDGIREEDELPGDYYEQSALFLAETADALEVAHAAGVIHRDLKPANILVTPDDHPKVSDFGLAKLTDEHSISLAGDLVGTYFYMSPEQVAAKRMGLDHRTDVFSLGVVLYEMLTLVRPFEGDTTEQVAHKILVVDPPPPNELRSKVPRDLAVICGKAMEKDPERRYGSMAELAADLRRHLADEAILARPPGTLERAVKWAKRNPTK
ncbi:MAG: serine/threonine protein kinase, partial [Actinomycetia bacterium]|nr:serine/threonine protein kinase [Actinomycetes bacterium]